MNELDPKSPDHIDPQQPIPDHHTPEDHVADPLPEPAEAPADPPESAETAPETTAADFAEAEDAAEQPLVDATDTREIEDDPTPAEIAAELEAVAPQQPDPEAPIAPLLAPSNTELRAVLEAIIYVTEEPLSLDQLASALHEDKTRIQAILDELVQDYARPERGLTIREVAGGYKMATKPEHHETIKQFVKNLKPALKLSLPALETLAVIAYKQPITAPEIMEIRGVQGAGVLKTLLDRKLIATAGRKNVVGKPILYKTTREFLVQFGLKDISELPTLKEFEELRRLAVIDEDPLPDAAQTDPTPQP